MSIIFTDDPMYRASSKMLIPVASLIFSGNPHVGHGWLKSVALARSLTDCFSRSVDHVNGWGPFAGPPVAHLSLGVLR